MSESGSTSLLSGPRLLWALALTVVLTAAGLTAARDAAGSPPSMVPAMVTVNPSTWTGSGTPVPTVPTSPPRTTYPPSPSSSAPPFPPPTGFVASSVKSNSVTLSWTAPTGGEIAGYDISYLRAFDDIARLKTVGNVTTTVITDGVLPASQFTFWLSARDTAGRSVRAASALVVVTPLSDLGPDTVPPAAPGSLTLTGVGPAGAALSWGPSTDNVGVTGYDVYWFDGWFSNRLVATVTGTSYTAPVSGPRNLYYVRARDAAGNISIATNTVLVNTSTPPPTSPSAPPPPVCRVAYKITAQWASGFVATVTITNTGPAQLNGWDLVFGLGGGQRVTSSWSSTFSQSEDWVTLKNASWNGVLASGASTTVGLVGSWPMIYAPPATFSLNGRPCA
jgi:cellulose 1,4-beta-cellobiosidase